MWLRQILKFPLRRAMPCRGRSIPAGNPAFPREYPAFREFTPPPRRQAGGVMRLGLHRGGRLAPIAIVPDEGAKIP